MHHESKEEEEDADQPQLATKALSMGNIHDDSPNNNAIQEPA